MKVERPKPVTGKDARPSKGRYQRKWQEMAGPAGLLVLTSGASAAEAAPRAGSSTMGYPVAFAPSPKPVGDYTYITEYRRGRRRKASVMVFGKSVSAKK